MLARRPFVLAGLTALAPAAARTAASAATGPLQPLPLAFPRDHGAHPDWRTEWWYLTGEVTAAERRFGFQVTFFRSRVDSTWELRSAFAARQLLFAHAALTDLQQQRLHHDQRIARSGFGIAQAAEGEADLRLRDWTLQREGQAWRAQVSAAGFGLELRFEATQPVLLQGAQGLSRKGPEAAQASWYYSLPQLATTGTVTLEGRRMPVAGRAWLDHEWSESLLHPQAVGWDWIGMNLLDGGALTAFRLRRQDGSTLWAGGSVRTRTPGGWADSVAGPGDIDFRPLRVWTSPLSRARYPVEWRVRALGADYTVRALADAQELDSRASTGALYWEGLSELSDPQGRPLGRGYLEMTGYAQPLRL